MMHDSAAIFRDFTPWATARTLLARLREHLLPPPGSETPLEAAEKREASRRVAGAEIARLKAQADAELPKLATAEEKARRRLDALRPGYQDAVRDYDTAHVTHSRRAHDLAYATQLQIRRIEAAAEPIIAEMVRGLNEMVLSNAATLIEEDERNKVWDGEGNRYVGEVWSNVPSIDARRVAIFAARDVAEAMKSDPDQSTVEERLAALIESLPDPTVMVKIADPEFRKPSRVESYREQRERLTGIRQPDGADERRAEAMARRRSV